MQSNKGDKKIQWTERENAGFLNTLNDDGSKKSLPSPICY